MLVVPGVWGYAVSGVMWLLVQVTGIDGLPAAVVVQALGIGGLVVCSCVVAALAPCAPGRRAWSFVWVAAYFLVDVGWAVVWLNPSPATMWVSSLVVRVMGVLGLGWWLTLRGRRARVYWVLAVQVVVSILIGYGQEAVFSGLAESGAGGAELSAVISAVFGIVSSLILWGCAWLAARVDPEAPEATRAPVAPVLR